MKTNLAAAFLYLLGAVAVVVACVACYASVAARITGAGF